MKNLPVGIAALAFTTLMLGGCASASVEPSAPGSDSNHSATSEDVSPESSATDSEPVTEPGAALGTVRINQLTTYAITELRNCEPLKNGTIERELELQGFGEHNGEPIQIDVYRQKVAGSAANSVSWSGPEGVFGSSDVARITWAPEDANVLGSSELIDSLTQTEKILIGFDLQVPAETVACR